MKRTKGRKTKKSKTRTRSNRKRMRGGCCGERALVGGSAGLDELPIRHYYDLADQTKNPVYAAAILGGKKRRMRGGMSDFLLPVVANLNNGLAVQPIIKGSGNFYV